MMSRAAYDNSVTTLQRDPAETLLIKRLRVLLPTTDKLPCWFPLASRHNVSPKERKKRGFIGVSCSRVSLFFSFRIYTFSFVPFFSVLQIKDNLPCRGKVGFNLKPYRLEFNDFYRCYSILFRMFPAPFAMFSMPVFTFFSHAFTS
jgi:hypothetical protein